MFFLIVTCFLHVLTFMSLQVMFSGKIIELYNGTNVCLDETNGKFHVINMMRRERTSNREVILLSICVYW